jgi:membrane peptidoglycan carboxypeptidase
MAISVANSLNIPAIKSLMYAGVNNVVDLMKRLGVTALDSDLAHDIAVCTWTQTATAAQLKASGYTQCDPTKLNYESDFGPSLALGTATIPLVQMVGGYQTFADNGVRVPQHSILAIYDNYGRQLYGYDENNPGGTQVISPQVDYLLTSMLSNNDNRQYEFGLRNGTIISTLTVNNMTGYSTYAGSSNDPNHQVAAKTGTTTNNVDNWTIGYSPQLVVGVWSGNADGNGDPMSSNIIGITGAAPIWRDVMEYASGRSLLDMSTDLHYSIGSFTVPSGVTKATVSSTTGLLGTGTTDWMITGEQPQQTGICNTTNNNGNGNNNNNTTTTNTTGCTQTTG